MKKFNSLLFLSAVLCFHTAMSQNTSPFWSLAGNSNSNSVSKLGTTIAEPLNLTTNNLTRIKIYEDGRVGVGANVTNANATRVLNLVDGNAVMRILRVHPNFAPAIELLSRTSSDGPNVAYWDAYAEPSDASFRIRDRVTGGLLDRLTIKNNGNVGIGTTAPNQKLHVAGNQTLAGNLFFTSGQHSIQFANPGLAPNAMIYMLASGTTNPDRMVLAHSPAFPTWGLQYSDATDRFDFLGAGTSRLSIDLGSGRIGVGNTDPGYILDVGGRMRLRTGGGSAGLWLNNNANTSEIGFMGVLNDDHMGFYGTGVGWGMVMNTANGNVGIGNTAPPTKLTVTTTTAGGTAAARIQNLSGSSFNDGLYVQAGSNTGSGSWYLRFQRPDGSSIGTISQASATSVAYNTTSDKRLKANIKESRFGLPDIKKIEVRDYNYIGAKDVHTGFIAQQLYEVYPEAVTVGGEDPKERPWMIDYGRVTPLLVKGMQDLSRENEQLRERIEKLEGALNKLLNGQSGNFSATGTLLQNVPNPARGTTTIQYTLPDGVSRAQLLLTDALGRTIRVLPLGATTSGTVNLNVSGLGSGLYNYSLVVDGKTLHTMKMTVTR